MIHKKIFSIGISCMFIALPSITNAQDKTPVDSIRKQLEQWFISPEASDKVLLNTRLRQLSASTQENEMMLAANYFYRLKEGKTADSIFKSVALKFPSGLQARTVAQQEIYNEKKPQIMEAAYEKWVKQFPPDNFKTGAIDDGVAYDYVVSAIATGYANENNVAKAAAYADKLQADFWKANAYAGLTEAFRKNNDLVHASIYAKKAMESAAPYFNGEKGSSNAAKFAASGYVGLTNTYAGILFDEKKYDEALKYIQLAQSKSPELNVRILTRYADILSALNRDTDAFDKLEEIVKAGKATPQIGEHFKALYVKMKGSEAGFDNYATQIRNAYIEVLKKKLAKEIVNESAATFTLTDINGKKVSLANYKGKTVVIDFWATWCGPCIASFPAMQMAVNKYKDDPNVAFLFIHTWERTTTPLQDAKTYITNAKYNFEVLIDAKDPATSENKVVTSYKVIGIPAKFVIDPKGKIRFKLTGFDGSNEAAVDEISLMIDMIKAGS